MTFAYKNDPSVGGTPPGDIHAFVHFTPSSTDTTARPVVIIFNAGGFASGTPMMIPPAQVHFFTSKGFVVVLPEYRLCPQVNLLDGPMQDAKDCLEWTKNELPALMEKKAGLKVDGEKVAAMGHSAGGALALSLGAEPSPPSAILDFYGPKYFTDSFWSQPLPAFSAIPDAALQPSHIDRIREGPVALGSRPIFEDGKPNLSDPRCAWMIAALKNGTLHQQIIGDGDLESVEPTRGFKMLADGQGKDWPATCFVHGTADMFAPMELSEKAERELKDEGAEVELIKVEGAAHGFDLGLAEGNELFDGPVVKALMWLKEHV